MKNTNQTLKPSIYNIWYKNYLINTFRRSIASIGEEHLGQVKTILHKPNNKTDDNGIAFTEKLTQEGFLVGEDMDELSLLKNNYFKLRTDNNFYRIVLVPTYQCNMSCPYCYQKEKFQMWTSDRVEILKAYFSSILNSDKKQLSLALFGGEPLIKYTDLIDLLGHIKQLQKKIGFTYTCSCTTNGTLLNSDRINKLVDEYDCNIYQLTIDGAKEQHDQRKLIAEKYPSYNKVIDVIKLLVQKKINSKKNMEIIVKFNLLNDTLDDIDLVFNDFSEPEKKNIKVYFRSIYSIDSFKGKEKIDLTPFYKLAKERGVFIYDNFYQNYSYCESDIGFIINPDLSVWKCNHN
ncbi:MAG: radical SAM protein, partial [Oligoflexia bacterium]|nr:radical SAM protein [Oligoflexia bacterium]